jgi:Short C-terminal domain
MMVVRRRGMPLLRGAIVGGAAYSMGRRAAAGAQREPQQDVASRLAQLSGLLQQGVLTPDEFAQAKAKVLAG